MCMRTGRKIATGQVLKLALSAPFPRAQGGAVQRSSSAARASREGGVGWASLSVVRMFGNRVYVLLRRKNLRKMFSSIVRHNVGRDHVVALIWKDNGATD